MGSDSRDSGQISDSDTVKDKNRNIYHVPGSIKSLHSAAKYRLFAPLLINITFGNRLYSVINSVS